MLRCIAAELLQRVALKVHDQRWDGYLHNLSNLAGLVAVYFTVC